MKLNKRIASGALALALVTPVVANAAQDTTYVTTKLPKTVEDKVEVDGKTLTKAQFERALEEASKDYNAYLAAKKNTDSLKEAYDTAVERYNKAYDEFKAQNIVDADGNVIGKAEVQSNFDIALENLNNKKDGEALTEEKNFALNDGKVRIVEDNAVKAEDQKDYDLTEKADLNLASGEFDQAIDRAKKAYKELKEADSKVKDAQEKYREYTTASQEKDRLEEEYEAAKKESDRLEGKSNASVAALKGFAEAFNVIVTATNNGIEVKDDDKTPSKDKITDEQLAKLQETVKNARETLKAVEILKQFMPNTSTANIEKLDKIAAEQRVALEKAEKILKANNITASLFSTAYAAEEEATSEDVDALIDELETNDKEMKDLMKEIDKDAKKDDEKPADDDKKDDEKPADDDKKDDEKPADDDKKDDEKPAENKDNKKDTTKVVKRTANKKAGSNAKTGIAGVAGVAGVLAAASVAYAASKKNN
ncbi:hypothetical protein ACKRLN_08430 [Anaerococcus sp. DFU013_CI05]|uniref:hypothetical protein n=1 Tax=Anaerococcus sp. AH8042_DFU013_CI05 TaxID=3385202 RepID=UPI003A521334